MTTPGVVTSWAALLRLLGCSKASDLEFELVEYVDYDIDDAWAIVTGGRGMPEVGVELGSPHMASATGNSIAYPFTLDEFWTMIDDLDQVNAEKMERLDLPQIGELDESYQLLDSIALLLSVDVEELLYSLGGGWVSFDEFIPGQMRGNAQWFAAGEPPLVVLGMTKSILTLSGGTIHPDSMMGPAHFETLESHEFRTDDFTDLDNIKEVVDAIITKARRRLKLCRGCRQFTTQIWSDAGEPPLCKDCMTVHTGIIYD